MNELALLCIGIGIGLSLALVAVMVYGMWTMAAGFRRTVNASLAKVNDSLTAQKVSQDKMRTEILQFLSRIDSERLYEASQTIRKASKSLGEQVETLQKALFSTQASPALNLDTESYGIDDEAMDDARMIAERNRWKENHTDPLDGMSEEEKNLRVQQFFERRQREQGIHRIESTPPTSASGAYATLLDEAQVPPSKPVPDINQEADEGELDLTDKGELGV